jgi:hypothetical protein
MTAKRSSPPAAVKLRVVGLTAYVHVGAAASWRTVCVRPCDVIVAERDSVAVFVWTVYDTSAGPVPDVLASVTHGLLLDALHSQVGPVVMVNVFVPPSAPTFRDSGAIS